MVYVFLAENVECNVGNSRDICLRNNLVMSDCWGGIISEHDNIFVDIVRVMTSVNMALWVHVCIIDTEGVSLQRSKQISPGNFRYNSCNHSSDGDSLNTSFLLFILLFLILCFEKSLFAL